MEFTRRRVLETLAAAGLLSVLPHHAGAATTTAAGAAPAAEPGDTARLLGNALTTLTGTEAANSRPETAAKLAALAATARTNLADLDRADPDTEVFAGLPLGTSDPNLTTTHRRLYEIALATRTPGLPDDLHGSEQVTARTTAALTRLHRRWFADQQAGYYGNWHTWEIGVPTHATRALALLHGRPGGDDGALARAYTASMDAYLRNGKDGDVDLDSRFHTGANLADITANRMLQGALLGDGARIRKAVEDQLTVFATIDPYRLRHGNTDGHYADGSFIQHHSVAYTGSYGRALLTRVVQTLNTLTGTGYADTAALVPTVVRWVRDGFAPLVFEGWMMEAVKGRAVSRTSSGYSDAATVVEAVTDLAEHAPDDEATALKGWVKHIRAGSRVALDPSRFASPLSIVRYTALLADPAVPAADLNPPARCTAFNAMDRTVHRRPGFAFALSRTSDRISRYEYMSGENLRPWFQGDGAHHLYLAGHDQSLAHGIDALATVSPYRLPGTTVPEETRKTVPELYDGKLFYDNPGHPLEFTPSSESQNTYVYFPLSTSPHSGGAVLGAYGTAALLLSDDIAYRDKQRGLLPDDFAVYRNARAAKSWFLLDDEVVVLAAGIGDEDGRAVTTTLDTRISAPADRVSLTGELTDGTRISGAEALAGADLADARSRPRLRLRWLRYASTADGADTAAVGYLLLDRAAVRVGLEEVTGSYRDVRTGNPDTPVTKRVFTLTSGAPARESRRRRATLAYALLPNASEDDLRRRDRGLTVLANSPRLQALRAERLDLTLANSFDDGRHRIPGRDGFEVDGPASVVLRRRGPDGRGRTTRLDVSVADPTTRRSTVTLHLKGRHRLAEGDAAEVRVRRERGGTRVDVSTRHRYGRSVLFALEEEGRGGDGD